jgi:hypothetical protein
MRASWLGKAVILRALLVASFQNVINFFYLCLIGFVHPFAVPYGTRRL